MSFGPSAVNRVYNFTRVGVLIRVWIRPRQCMAARLSFSIRQSENTDSHRDNPNLCNAIVAVRTHLTLPDHCIVQR